MGKSQPVNPPKPPHLAAAPIRSMTAKDTLWCRRRKFVPTRSSAD